MKTTTKQIVELLEQFKTGQITLATLWERVEELCIESNLADSNQNIKSSTEKPFLCC